ncbi:chymotrypsin-like elastase family member 1 [Agrilus planipennis]|uniref:Chymotrypsin-like elastase family member 1 n=1 Tax=Agrilus planipennis TaxID=224129 RepID=A0A1W4WTH8_AGRPL|nr:chymotrypsin-like elastase family member 1 [Agrilus planipennis]
MNFLFLFLTVPIVAGSPLIHLAKRSVTAQRNQFPYHVQLVYTYKIPLISRCSGATISENYVLTTANCATTPPTSVIAGILERHEISPHRQMVKVKKVKIHPLYIRLRGIYNVALIHLDFPLKFNSAVNKIDLPPPDYEIKGTAQQTGWEWRLLFPNYKLQVTEKQLIRCSFRKFSLNPFNWNAKLIQKRILCAKGEGPLSECKKDSGEPLVQDKYLIGLSITDVTKCKLFASTSVYANVLAYVSWLRNEMGEILPSESTTTPSLEGITKAPTVGTRRSSEQSRALFPEPKVRTKPSLDDSAGIPFESSPKPSLKESTPKPSEEESSSPSSKTTTGQTYEVTTNPPLDGSTAPSSDVYTVASEESGRSIPEESSSTEHTTPNEIFSDEPSQSTSEEFSSAKEPALNETPSEESGESILKNFYYQYIEIRT